MCIGVICRCSLRIKWITCNTTTRARLIVFFRFSVSHSWMFRYVHALLFRSSTNRPISLFLAAFRALFSLTHSHIFALSFSPFLILILVLVLVVFLFKTIKIWMPVYHRRTSLTCICIYNICTYVCMYKYILNTYKYVYMYIYL